MTHETREPILAWRGNIPVTNLYTVGVAGQRFFDALKRDGVLLGSKCPKCGSVTLPPSLFCEPCFVQCHEFVPVGPKGRVRSFTLARLDLDEQRVKRPKVVAFIEFEGVHGGLLYYLGDVRPTRVRIGMPVEPVLKPPAKRTGTQHDIEHFRPA